jgi:hypothetical protein
MPAGGDESAKQASDQPVEFVEQAVKKLHALDSVLGMIEYV